MRTHGNATHARDTGLFVHPLGIVFVDSANGTRCGTSPAGGALLCGLRYHTGAPGLLIGTITRNSRLRSISCRYLLLNLIRKPSELCRVLRIWSAGGKLANNRMLGDGRNRRDHPKTRALCRVLKLDQRVLIRAISVNTNQNRSCIVPSHHTQALHGHSWDSPAIRGHRITATSSFVIATVRNPSPLSARSTATVSPSNALAM